MVVSLSTHVLRLTFLALSHIIVPYQTKKEYPISPEYTVPKGGKHIRLFFLPVFYF